MVSYVLEGIKHHKLNSKITDMAANFSHVCLTETQQMMNGTPLEYNLQRYVYPAIAVFGILGNVLNLTVLLNKSMRSRANTFLATLAFADIIFLSLLFPNILANYSIFTFNYYFRYFYFHSKVLVREARKSVFAHFPTYYLTLCVGLRVNNDHSPNNTADCAQPHAPLCTKETTETLGNVTTKANFRRPSTG
ncbi:hypothetical protein NECAME_17230 [Necator americanus]|uniref:G-protein coupled receptors family 1 profile domain-containing protein n=1 Tax=Necator americanus TaxID=51031 RepID=W2TSV4_NECAM|nr:hypothetical protein NECAME_17230 [Necator americanus]ETN84132.1 hypothetical protein NECAME_17230 [Necator americanus]